MLVSLIRKYGLIFSLPTVLLASVFCYFLGLDLAIPLNARTPEKRVETFVVRHEKESRRTQTIRKLFDQVNYGYWIGDVEKLRFKIVFQPFLCDEPVIRKNSSQNRLIFRFYQQHDKFDKIVKQYKFDGRTIVETVNTRSGDKYLFTLVQEEGDWKFDRGPYKAELPKQQFLLTQTEQEIIRNAVLKQTTFSPISREHKKTLDELFILNSNSKLNLSAHSFKIDSGILVLGELNGPKNFYIVNHFFPTGEFPIYTLAIRDYVSALKIVFDQEREPLKYVRASFLKSWIPIGKQKLDHHIDSRMLMLFDFQYVCDAPFQFLEMRKHETEFQRNTEPFNYIDWLPRRGETFVYLGIDSEQKVVSAIVDASTNLQK